MIRAEIYEIETKKTIEKINATKSLFLKRQSNLTNLSLKSPIKKEKTASLFTVKKLKLIIKDTSG